MTVDANYAFSAEHWKYEEFAQAVSDLRSAIPRTSTDNFLLLNANPGNVDWFDDAGWKEIVDHWRILAKVARAGRLKGFIFDSEAYSPPHQQFNYSHQAKRENYSLSEYSVKARERGQEVMRAVVKEFPEITILAYRLLSDFREEAHSALASIAAQEKNQYGLIPAFLNGWLDVISRSARIVDGNELSYLYNSEVDFSRSYTQIKNDVSVLVAQENRVKFRRCWQVGQAIYMDAYCTPPDLPLAYRSKGGH